MDACYTAADHKEENHLGITSASVLAAWAQRLSVVFGHVRKACTGYERRRQQRMDRDAFLHLLSLDDVMLDDIGVDREELLWAANLPLQTNAALVLAEVSRARRKTA